MAPIVVAALYRFAPFEDPACLAESLRDLCGTLDTRGTLLLAHEGINGTVAGSRQGVDRLLNTLRALPGCADLQVRESLADAMPFHRMKVKVKPEIVTMGVPGLDPRSRAGTYVTPKEWNDLIRDPDVTLIDTRNDYEVAIGTFAGAIDPHTDSFRQFPSWFQENYGDATDNPFALFCTGGIRCEKATAYLKSIGVHNVFHLKGGILSYLERVDPTESLWRGECFVFDQRTAVTHGLETGTYGLCHGCRRPISDVDRQSSLFREGVSCPACHDAVTPLRRARFQERQRQMVRAEELGIRHLGADHGGHPSEAS